jgi:hypothetical protein
LGRRMSSLTQGVVTSSPLKTVIGVTALVAPALHSITDVMEWYHNGLFTSAQLWLNYLAFLPMPWLLLGMCAVQQPRSNLLGITGALSYGVAFTYFAHTTLYAISEHVPNYEDLWSHLGSLYTVHGAFMVAGGLMFSWSAFRGRWLPKIPVLLFAAGIAVNLVLALLPGPDILQTIGTAVRNAGLIGMGYALLIKCARSR